MASWLADTCTINVRMIRQGQEWLQCSWEKEEAELDLEEGPEFDREQTETRTWQGMELCELVCVLQALPQTRLRAPISVR